jgi:anaerobic selenocysteine-containing dehydrogenase
MDAFVCINLPMPDLNLITACTLDCPDACSLMVTQTADGRISIRGNPEHPATRGFTCAKIRKHIRRISSRDRIVHPVIRTGKGWERIGWDRALDICARKIRECRSDPASILYFHGEGAKGVLKHVGVLFFNLLGASSVRGSFCDSAGFSACVKDFGSRETNDIETLAAARAVINWGKDLQRSSVHMARLVREARRKGAGVITISPGGDLNSSYSDHRIRIRPGTDRFLAAAAIRILLEGNRIREDILSRIGNWDEFSRVLSGLSVEELLQACGVSREDAALVAEYYLERKPAATVIGAGVQRYRYGGENIRFINAVAMLTGNIGIRGGGSHFHLNSLRNLNLSWTRPKEEARRLRMPLIGQDIMEADNPPVRMMWIDGSNLVNQAPGSLKVADALDRVEFKVVADAFMTDTASRADLILPVTLMLEQEDLVASYMHEFIQYARPVLEPPGEARTDYRIFSDLGKLLDPPVTLPDEQTCLKESIKTPYLDVSLDTLKGRGFARARRPEIAYEGLRFDHPDGKYRLPSSLHAEPDVPEGYPLRLMSLIRRDAVHSQMMQEDQRIPPRVWISPECPELQKLDLSGSIALVSPLGGMPVKVELMEGLHPQAVLYRRGDWMKLGGGVNRIIEPRLTDMGAGTAYYEQYVRLENRNPDEGCPV